MEGSYQRGGSQFRRANIVYFLSRNGTVEPPHLIRVRHFHDNGVHLRDVKRWLAELRGKDMPDSFSWSYKRKYKSLYVWQDLKDGDLITPIADNEYVLKGSLLHFHSIDGFPHDDIENIVTASKRTIEKAVTEHQLASELELEPEAIQIEQADEVSPKPPPEMECGSLMKLNIDRRMTAFDMKASAKKQEGERQNQTFKRSYSSRASHVFRNILTCGSADARDSVLVPTSRSGDHGTHKRRSTGGDVPRQQTHQRKSSDEDSSRKSQRSSGRRIGGSASYKTLGAPNCSQCGRSFDPEKFHSHMQSCKALRGRGKGRASSDRRPLRRESRCQSEDFSRDSLSGYLT
ncbi:uncharacterized protein LOC109832142 [Asparagus officinalis]|nr:uncharacterized protein LOC109832142 [Asparagus officinalis]